MMVCKRLQNSSRLVSIARPVHTTVARVRVHTHNDVDHHRSREEGEGGTGYGGAERRR